MTATPENIHKKEESLASLMHKVLQAPLQPLGAAIEKINDELAATQKNIIEQITNASGASAADIEDTKKDIKKDIKKCVDGIKEIDIPKLKSEIAQSLSAQTQAHSEATQTLAASIHAHAQEHAAQLQSTSETLLAACQTSSQQHAQQHTQLAQSLQTWSDNLEQAHTTLLERQTTQIQTALHAIAMGQEAAQQTKAQTTAHLRAALTQQIAASDTAMATQVTTAQTTLLAKLASTQQTLTGMQATQTGSHTALMHMLDKQHMALGQQLEQAHNKLQRLTVVVGIFFACTLIYVGYDIWHQLR